MLNRFKHISPSSSLLIFLPFIKYFTFLSRLAPHCTLRRLLCSVFAIHFGCSVWLTLVGSVRLQGAVLCAEMKMMCAMLCAAMQIPNFCVAH